MSQSLIARNNDTKITLPQSLPVTKALEILQKQMEFEETTVEIIHEYKVFPWDGAVALFNVLKERFGWVTVDGGTKESFFGPIKQKPKFINVEVAPGEVVSVPWGEFPLPNLDGAKLTTFQNPGTGLFSVMATTKRKHETEIKQILQHTEDYLKTHSIYRGKAVRASFTDDEGDTLGMPDVKFMDVSGINENDLILPRAVETAVTTNLFAALEHPEACRRAGIPLKRGILLEGPWGTGKSLTAAVAAKKATKNGWTYVYVQKTTDLAHAVRFAQTYQPAVVFCEDIDRAVAGNRTENMDNILNVIDGIETKNSEIVVILTSNYVDNINVAMLRPGRLDAIIHMETPDAETVVRLVKKYSRGQLTITEADEPKLQEVGILLAGQVPAVIREAVERAKLSAIKLSGGRAHEITVDALKDAAESMAHQLVLLNAGRAKDTDMKTAYEKLVHNFVHGILRSNMAGSGRDVAYESAGEQKF